jgi:hypothetical protein
MRFILDVVAEVRRVRRPELPVLVVLDPRLAQDMYLPLPNSALKHLVGQNDHRFRTSVCQHTYFFPSGAASTAIVHLSVFSRVPGLIIPPRFLAYPCNGN